MSQGTDCDVPRRRRIFEGQVIKPAENNIESIIGKSSNRDSPPRQIAVPSRRRVFEAQVISAPTRKEEEEDNENELNQLIGFGSGDDETSTISVKHQTSTIQDDFKDDFNTRHNRALAKIAMKPAISDTKVESSSDSSEYEYVTETESEDEVTPILKPVFVPKHLRGTVVDEEKRIIEEELNLKKKIQQDEERIKNSRGKLAETLKRNELADANDVTDMDSESGLPDDTDDIDELVEYQNWKLREIQRMKRDALEREKDAFEKKEIERRRHMTEEERLEEDKKLGIGIFKVKEKEKWNFMQRYYHKGVFYMDDDTLNKDKDDVRTRSYAEPTLEDRVDKQNLPAVLQVKKFGMRGRTKYTHLVDQDTTDYRGIKPNQKVMESYLNKRSGVGGLDKDSYFTKKQKK